MPALSGVSTRLLLHCCWLVAKGEFGYGFHYHVTPTSLHTHTFTHRNKDISVFVHKLFCSVAVIFLPLLISHTPP